MKKKIITKFLFGIPLGITISIIISIAISLVVGNGNYLPTNPLLDKALGSGLKAFIQQTILSGLLGGVCFGTSVIWDMENISLLTKSASYFSIIVITNLVVGYLNYWTNHSLKGILIYFILFAIIFVIIWIIMYFIKKNEIDKINEKLKK